VAQVGRLILENVYTQSLTTLYSQLALKHRQNKNLRQRIIALVGSPLDNTTAADLVKLGKRLKKNNVACDIVNFGEESENEEKLKEFTDAVNSQDNRCVDY
jgi:26S proteasome regulatory subunit N10